MRPNYSEITKKKSASNKPNSKIRAQKTHRNREKRMIWDMGEWWSNSNAKWQRHWKLLLSRRIIVLGKCNNVTFDRLARVNILRMIWMVDEAACNVIEIYSFWNIYIYMFDMHRREGKPAEEERDGRKCITYVILLKHQTNPL